MKYNSSVNMPRLNFVQLSSNSNVNISYWKNTSNNSYLLLSAETSIYERWVNHWNSEDHPNVINIFVSATPWNLISKDSRFEYKEIGYNSKTKTYEMVTQQTDRSITNKYWLFDLNWSLAHNDVYNNGRKLRLMVRFVCSTCKLIQQNNWPFLSSISRSPKIYFHFRL